jgi:quercetin dioxygenase-like cupin family protein
MLTAGFFYIVMTYDICLLSLEKKNLYYSAPADKKEEKYQGKFTSDDFEIREIVDADTSQEEEMYYVTFKKGCRTRPHIHASDQILVAIKGKGIVVCVDKIEINSGGKSAAIRLPPEEKSSGSSSSIIELDEGDVVCVPAGTLHWHGALENNKSEFSHLAIRKRTDTETKWF